MSQAELPRTLRRRATLALVTLTALGVGSSLCVAYFGAVVPHRQELDAALVEQSDELARLAGSLGPEGLERELRARAATLGGEGWLYSVSAPGGADGAGNLGVIPPATPGGHPVDRRVGARLVRARVVGLADGRRLAVAHDITRQARFEERLLLASLLGGLLVLSLSVAAGRWLGRRLFERMEQMNATILGILGGQRTARVVSREPADEFDVLARHFNELLDENERLLAGVREVTDDIAHDLRTPLARVRQDLEAALARPRAGEEDAAVLERTLASVNVLLDTFQALLAIARIESGTIRESMTEIDLALVLRDVAELYAPTAEHAGLSFELGGDRSVPVRGNRHLLSQAVSNLLDNALKFAPAPGRIELRALARPEGALLVVADHGPGIPPAQHAHVLERFVRLDSSRGTPGSGLGLSLVAAVARLHGASLEFADNGPGLVASIRFPAPAPAGARG